MHNQHIRSTPQQYRLTVGFSLIALAVFLVVALIGGLLSPGKDAPSVYLTVIASIGFFAGLLGLLIAIARQFGWWLPSFLRIPKERRDENWRLFFMSLVAIAIPLIMMMIQRLLFH